MLLASDRSDAGALERAMRRDIPLSVLATKTRPPATAGWELDAALLSTFVVGIANFAFTLVSFWTIDRYGRRPVYLVGAIAAGTWGFFAFPMMNTGNYLAIMGAIIIGLMIHALMYAPQPAIMAEMFPTRMRYSGVSLGYHVTSIVAGSLAPIIAVKLLDIYDSWVPIALYLAGAAVVTLIAALFMRETKGIDLATVDQADRDDLAKAGVA